MGLYSSTPHRLLIDKAPIRTGPDGFRFCHNDIWKPKHGHRSSAGNLGSLIVLAYVHLALLVSSLENFWTGLIMYWDLGKAAWLFPLRVCSLLCTHCSFVRDLLVNPALI